MPLLTVEQVAERLNASRGVVRSLIESGDLPAFDLTASRVAGKRVKRTYKVEESEVLALLERRKVQGPPPKIPKPIKRRLPPVPQYVKG